jgi:hypothetical protein
MKLLLFVLLFLLVALQLTTANHVLPQNPQNLRPNMISRTQMEPEKRTGNNHQQYSNANPFWGYDPRTAPPANSRLDFSTTKLSFRSVSQFNNYGMFDWQQPIPQDQYNAYMPYPMVTASTQVWDGPNNIFVHNGTNFYQYYNSTNAYFMIQSAPGQPFVCYETVGYNFALEVEKFKLVRSYTSVMVNITGTARQFDALYGRQNSMCCGSGDPSVAAVDANQCHGKIPAPNEQIADIYYGQSQEQSGPGPNYGCFKYDVGFAVMASRYAKVCYNITAPLHFFDTQYWNINYARNIVAGGYYYDTFGDFSYLIPFARSLADQICQPNLVKNFCTNFFNTGCPYPDQPNVACGVPSAR